MRSVVLEPPVTQGFLVVVVMASAPVHISALLVTLVTVQVEMSWLNAAALLNMFVMRVTASVFHLSLHVRMAWLNAVASLNMELMSVTSAVSQEEMSLLKIFAPSNMEGKSSLRPCPSW